MKKRSLGQFLPRTIVVAVAVFGLGYVGHQLILGPAYSSIVPIMRDHADMQSHMPFALISSLCFSAAFVWIYAQGQSTKPWLGQGLRLRRRHLGDFSGASLSHQLHH